APVVDMELDREYGLVALGNLPRAELDLVQRLVGALVEQIMIPGRVEMAVVIDPFLGNPDVRGPEQFVVRFQFSFPPATAASGVQDCAKPPRYRQSAPQPLTGRGAERP